MDGPASAAATNGGYIVRTAAEGASEEELRRVIRIAVSFLERLGKKDVEDFVKALLLFFAAGEKRAKDGFEFRRMTAKARLGEQLLDAQIIVYADVEMGVPQVRQKIGQNQCMIG